MCRAVPLRPWGTRGGRASGRTCGILWGSPGRLRGQCPVHASAGRWPVLSSRLASVTPLPRPPGGCARSGGRSARPSAPRLSPCWSRMCGCRQRVFRRHERHARVEVSKYFSISVSPSAGGRGRDRRADGQARPPQLRPRHGQAPSREVAVCAGALRAGLRRRRPRRRSAGRPPPLARRGVSGTFG